jgi:hypothetical protein
MLREVVRRREGIPPALDMEVHTHWDIWEVRIMEGTREARIMEGTREAHIMEGTREARIMEGTREAHI